MIRIPKGTPITADGVQTTAKKSYDITINHVLHGHYYQGVHHPSFSWGGKNGWNEAYFKDILK